MILVSDKTQQKTYYFPKEKNSGKAAFLKLFSHLSKNEYLFNVSGSAVLDLYYALSPDFSGCDEGEYDYTIYDVENNVLQNGLLRIGEYDAGDIIYDFKEEYIVYNPETGESEIIEYGDCTDAVNDAYRSGYTSGYANGYEEGYSSGTTDGFNSGYSSGKTDGLKEGFDNGYESGFTDGYESGCSGSYEDAYNAGLQAGIESGKTIGFESGWTNGISIGYGSGYTEGYQEGYVEGNADGFSSGYSSGWESGYTSGYTDGYSSGYESGNTDGFNSGYTNGKTEGFEDGYESGSTDGYNSGWTDGYSSGWTDGYESGYTPTPSENIIINAPTTIPASATDFTYSIVSNLDGDIMVYRNNELWNSGGTFQSGTTSYRQGVWGSTANTVVYRIEAYGSDSASTASRTVLQVPPTPSGYTSTRFSVEMLEDGDINWDGVSLYYDIIRNGVRDEGYQLDHSVDGLLEGDVVEFYTKSDNPVSFSNKILTATGKHNVFGNIMSLLYVDFEDIDTIPNNYEFQSLFNRNTNLINAENLVLPATTLSSNCYDGMFYSCTSLITAPKLPATTLAIGCYYGMFWSCTSLTEAPELPATTLATGCYESMFEGCTSLTEAPELPATTLAVYCYENMFDYCTSLTEAPELPATTLAEGCYSYMFYRCSSLVEAPELPATTLTEMCYASMFGGCTSLTEAPVLPATTLAEACYNNMFKDCSNLNYIKCLATDISADYCLIDWVYGVASAGTFVKDANMNDWTTDDDGIPSGWSVISE